MRACGTRGWSARLSALIAIGGLLLLVFIHELGHFLAAKAVGMRVTKFYIGFPPAVVKKPVGDTEYGIGLIPLGGFVRIVGMGRPRGGDLSACGEAAAQAAGRRSPDEPDALTPALERARAAVDGGDAGSSADALGRLTEQLERDAELIDDERLGWCRKELQRVERGLRRARLLAPGHLAAPDGDHRRPGCQRAGGLRDPDDLLRPRRPELRADDARCSRSRSTRRPSAWASCRATS